MEVAINPSNLKIYTNRKYSYSVKYPAGWTSRTTSESSNASTVFTSDNGFMISQVIFGEALPDKFRNLPDEFMDKYMKIILNDETILNRQNVSLPNGHSGIVFTMKGTGGPTPSKKRGKAVYTVVNGDIYLVIVMVDQNAYTSTVEQGINTIITSLTIA